MNILDVIRNEFLHAIGTDHIAVDHAGTPIARAADRASVEHAAPDAAAYFSGADFEEAAPAPAVGDRDWATGLPTDVEPAWVSAAIARSAPVAEVPATAPAPVVAEIPQVDATTAPPAPELTDEERTAIFNEPSDMFDQGHVDSMAEEPPDPVVTPAEQPPQDSDLLPTAKTAPIDLSLAPVAPDAPAVFSRPVIVAPEAATVQAEQPPQDNDHVEPGAEEFPEPTVPAPDPGKLN